MKICRNLRYSLEKLMLGSDRENYNQLVDSVVVGPANVTSSDVNMVLGVNVEVYNRSRKKRTELIESGDKPSWLEKEVNNTSGRSQRLQSLPNISQYGKRKLSNAGNRQGRATRSLPNGSLGGSTGSNNSLLRSALERQFDMFSRFGGSETQGNQITLTQSDKWLRQARVIDSWNVTTIDTALAFRLMTDY